MAGPRNQFAGLADDTYLHKLNTEHPPCCTDTDTRELYLACRLYVFCHGDLPVSAFLPGTCRFVLTFWWAFPGIQLRRDLLSGGWKYIPLSSENWEA